MRACAFRKVLRGEALLPTREADSPGQRRSGEPLPRSLEVTVPELQEAEEHPNFLVLGRAGCHVLLGGRRLGPKLRTQTKCVNRLRTFSARGRLLRSLFI